MYSLKGRFSSIRDFGVRICDFKHLLESWTITGQYTAPHEVSVTFPHSLTLSFTHFVFKKPLKNVKLFLTRKQYKNRPWLSFAKPCFRMSLILNLAICYLMLFIV